MKLSLEHKVPPVAVTLIFIGLMWLTSTLAAASFLPEKLGMSCAALFAIAALAIGLAGVAAFRKANTTVNPLEPGNCSRLVESGIYRYSRNPMYLALLLALLGWGCFLNNPWSFIPVIAYILYIDRYQIKPEENALETAFGEEFQRYRQRVRKWL